MPLPQVVVVGECMLELVSLGQAPGRTQGWQLGYAGDTFNTALYLCRLEVPVTYLTALGTDPFSQDLRASWAGEGIDTSLVLTDGSRLPGLYTIRNDADGERHFYYWRERSAARRLFTLPGIEAALERTRRASWLFLSGITLSIFTPAEREQLVQTAAAVRAGGGQVAFDPNYRPALWSSAAQAREAFAAIGSSVSLALPTHADEATLFGDTEPLQSVQRWRQLGADEVVVKGGAQGCLVAAGADIRSMAAAAVVRPIDTTGAGDAFNAAYLAGRITGLAPVVAARGANRLAGEVIQHRGAILDPERMAALGDLWA
jgi:2-dehydro-3-deoxygluconokinase